MISCGVVGGAFLVLFFFFNALICSSFNSINLQILEFKKLDKLELSVTWEVVLEKS